MGRGDIPVGRVTFDRSQREFVRASWETRSEGRSARGKMLARESRRSIVRVGAARSAVGARAKRRLRVERVKSIVSESWIV